MRFPGRLKAGATSRQVMTMMDYFPTLAGACGVTPGNRLPLDGKNLWPSITGGKVEPRENLFFVTENNTQVRLAVRHGEWKLVREEPRNGEGRNHLFHIEDDPNESNDLAAKNPKLVEDLAARIVEWRKLHPADGAREGPQPAGYKAPPLWAEAARE
jgi:arylsulfatase A-like enzyme